MKKLFMIAALVAVFVPARAQEADVTMPFVAVNMNAETAAMGGISLFDNAASAMLTKNHALVNAVIWNPTSSYFAGADFSYKIKDIVGIRASFADNIETPYDIYDEFGVAGGQFKPNAMKASLGVSVKFAKYFSVGVEGLYARRVLAEEMAYNTFGGNAAFMMSMKGINVALGAKNLCAPVASVDGTKFSLPASAFIDAGYTIDIKGKNFITLAGEFEYLFSGIMAYGATMKYSYDGKVYVAAGYHGGGIVPDHVSAGLGLNIKGFTLGATTLIGASKGNQITKSAVLSVGYSF